MRWVSTRVLPLPAPARISSGPSPCVTASRWGSLSPSSSSSRCSAWGSSAISIQHRCAAGRPARRNVPAMALLRRGPRELRPDRRRARSVRIDADALAALAAQPELAPAVIVAVVDPAVAPAVVAAEPPPLDPESHYLEGEPEDVADYLLALDAINFGSGWFPDAAQAHEHGRALSGYFTVALGARRARARQRPARATTWLRAVEHTRRSPAILGQPPDHELMSLYAQALRALGRFLGERRALDAGRRLRRLRRARSPTALARGHGDVRRPRLLQARPDRRQRPRAGRRRAASTDLDRLTIFADNLVPHVLRCEGVLRLRRRARRPDRRRRDPAARRPQEREIRACALHACELISQRSWRAAAGARQLAVEPRPGARVQGAPAAPLPDGVYY